MESGDVEVTTWLDRETYEYLQILQRVRGGISVSDAVAEAIKLEAALIGHASTGVKIILHDAEGNRAEVPMEEIIEIPEEVRW